MVNYNYIRYLVRIGVFNSSPYTPKKGETWMLKHK